MYCVGPGAYRVHPTTITECSHVVVVEVGSSIAWGGGLALRLPPSASFAVLTMMIYLPPHTHARCGTQETRMWLRASLPLVSSLAARPPSSHPFRGWGERIRVLRSEDWGSSLAACVLARVRVKPQPQPLTLRLYRDYHATTTPISSLCQVRWVLLYPGEAEATHSPDNHPPEVQV